MRKSKRVGKSNTIAIKGKRDFSIEKISNIVPLGVYILITSVWIIAAWPGNFSGDSVMVWQQVKGVAPLYDWHPVAYTFFVKVTSLWGTFLPGTIISQSLITAWSLNWVLKVLFGEMSAVSRWWVLCAFSLTPFMSIQVTLWKDALFAAASIGGFSKMLHRIRRRERFILEAAITALGLSARHEGIFTILLFLFFLITPKSIASIRRKSTNRKSRESLKFINRLTKATLAVVTLTLIGSIFLPGITRATPGPNWVSTLPELRALVAVANTEANTMDPDIVRKLKQISNDQSWENATVCSSPNGFFAPNSGFDASLAEIYAYDAPIWWIKTLFSKNGFKLLKFNLCFIKNHVPFPFSISPGNGWLGLWWGIENNDLGVQRSNSSVSNLAATPVAWLFSFRSFLTTIAWPGLNFSILSVFYFFLIFKNSKQTLFTADSRYLILFVLCHSLILFHTVAGDSRYSTSLHYINSIIIFGLFAKVTIRVKGRMRLWT